jgi:UDP-N-acetylmuramate: L-alanyl-gamma-D-glutamyl-meso-diaminopimelate ligase
MSARMHVYFLGIAGAGVSALASILVSEGHRVSGSDEAAFPPMSTYLDALGVRYATRFAAENVPADVDYAIIGTSAKLHGEENPELAEIKRRGVPHATFAEFLGRHTADRENVVVAGSFGKSTLTAMLAYFMRQAGRDPGWFIGAIPLDLDRTGHAGSQPQMILEGDEYVVSMEDRRPKFALYKARHTLLSSIVHDHVNVYPTFESYVAPFLALVEATPPDGILAAARGFEAVRDVTAGREVVWYGAGEGPGYGAASIEIGETTRFDLVRPSGPRVPIATQLLGRHNIENLVGACALLLEAGWVAPDDLVRAAPGFRGVARRLDKKTCVSRVPCYEGFGSSYEKARSAIDAILLHFPTRPLVVVFEPHTFSWRNEDALSWYDTVFDGAARVLVLPPPDHGAHGHKQLSFGRIVGRIAEAGAPVEAMENGDMALQRLERTLAGDEVVLLLSSGALDGLALTLPPRLDLRFGERASSLP